MTTVEYIGYLDADGKGRIDRVLEDGSRSPLPRSPFFKGGVPDSPTTTFFRWGQNTLDSFQVAAALLMDVTCGNEALVKRLSRLVAHYWVRSLRLDQPWAIRRTDFETVVRLVIDCGSWSPPTPDSLLDTKEPIAPERELKEPEPEGWRKLQPKGQSYASKRPPPSLRRYWIGRIQCRNNHTVSFTILGKFLEPSLDAGSDEVIRQELASHRLKCQVCRSTKLHLLIHRSKFATLKEAHYWEALVAKNKHLSELLPHGTLSLAFQTGT